MNPPRFQVGFSIFFFSFFLNKDCVIKIIIKLFFLFFLAFFKNKNCVIKIIMMKNKQFPLL